MAPYQSRFNCHILLNGDIVFHSMTYYLFDRHSDYFQFAALINNGATKILVTYIISHMGKCICRIDSQNQDCSNQGDMSLHLHKYSLIISVLMERIKNLKCCLWQKTSGEFITETIKHIALKCLPIISIDCKSNPSFLQYVLSTFWVLSILVAFGNKTINKVDIVTALMVFSL